MATTTTTKAVIGGKRAALRGERLSAEERRDQVLDAAVAEFGERGYHAASTASIAKRAGISQPYIYALFADKKELFLAVHDRVTSRIRSAFLEAARGASSPEQALEAMGRAYRPLMQDRNHLGAQLQCYAVAAGDPELREHVGAGFRALVDEVARTSGASPEEVASFFACGMLINVTMALDLPEVSEPLLYDD
jgi:AcrR family transcriptional regulator